MDGTIVRRLQQIRELVDDLLKELAVEKPSVKKLSPKVITKDPPPFSSYSSPGRAKKRCPDCHQIAGARKRLCTCGHVFEIKKYQVGDDCRDHLLSIIDYRGLELKDVVTKNVKCLKGKGECKLSTKHTQVILEDLVSNGLLDKKDRKYKKKRIAS